MDRVNDFAFKIATANGTGSASANGLIMQAIFRMGIPVTGKNVFPSNIQGLPTWYEIRVSKDGYTARTPHFDLMVALNAATYAKDVAEVRSGGWLMFDSSWPLDEKLRRPDVTYLGVPLAELCNAAFKGVRERILMKNIAYAGALAALHRHRHRSGARAHAGEVLEEARAAGVERHGHRARLQLREGPLRVSAADSPRADGRDEGQDPDRRQHRRRPRLRVCRRHGGRVVSDHAVDLADGRLQGLLPEVPRRQGDQEEPLRDHPGGRRTGRHRHGDWRLVGRRARLHAHVGSGHLADERVHRPGLLRRGAGRDLRRAAHRAVHGHAHAHAARRPDAVRLRLARRHAPHLPVSVGPEGSLRDGGRRRSTWPNASRRRCSC